MDSQFNNLVKAINQADLKSKKGILLSISKVGQL